MAELDGSGNIQAVNTFGAQGLLSRHTTATNASVFYTFDERGNVAPRLNAGGSALSADLYDAFGARTGTAAPSDPWGFGAQWGYQTDNETGLVLCTNRFYDPQQGRFLTRDPLGYGGGINLYSYTANNPVNHMDPDGTDAIIFFGGDQKSQDQTWWDAAMAYQEIYEHSHPGQSANVFGLANGSDDMIAALNATQNIDTIIYIGHAGINSGGMSNFYTGTVAQNDITPYAVNRLPVQNVRSNPNIFLFGCDTAAGVDPVNGKKLAPGEMSMAQAFANHFHSKVKGFADHVGFGAPIGWGWHYDYYTTFHNGRRFVKPVTVSPTK